MASRWALPWRSVVSYGQTRSTIRHPISAGDFAAGGCLKPGRYDIEVTVMKRLKVEPGKELALPEAVGDALANPSAFVSYQVYTTENSPLDVIPGHGADIVLSNEDDDD